MRGRHAAELAHHVRRAATGHLARRDRAFRGLRLRLESRDPGRTLSGIRNRLGTADGHLHAAMRGSRHTAESRLSSLAGRLGNLSPLAVLARGYAVCWNADRTAIIRSASAVGPGDRVHIRLHDGEIDCRKV